MRNVNKSSHPVRHATANLMLAKISECVINS